jgi:glycosyltransferase involved in cell wall biosynthesis
MRISLSVPESVTITNHGYGVAAQGIVASLQRLGHQVPFRDPTAPVELNFSQPNEWVWSSKNSYKIGMAAWESNKIPERWKAGLQTCDELWTPSPIIADWLRAEGYPARVYEHGVDYNVWTAKRRRREDGPIRFLHIGEPAPRKAGQMVYDAFKENFGNTEQARLTIKAFGSSTIRGENNAHPHKELNNVKLINDVYEEWQMVDLVRRHDVLVYPSFGEGFGLIPLQAMVTGMPTIITEGWAPYQDLTQPSLRVPTKLGPSPWPNIHNGDMLIPDKFMLGDAMREAAGDFDYCAQRAYNRVPKIRERYDWDRLTAEAFAHIVERFEV